MAKEPKPSTDEAGAEDMISHDNPVLKRPLDERIALRASLEDVMDADALDALYGADTRDPELDDE